MQLVECGTPRETEASNKGRQARPERHPAAAAICALDRWAATADLVEVRCAAGAVALAVADVLLLSKIVIQIENTVRGEWQRPEDRIGWLG